MNESASVRITVYGLVQGVYFRAFVARRARELDLTGYVRNTREGTVEVYAEGERKQVKNLIDHIRIGPTAARVDRVETEWSEYAGNYSGFSIRY